MAARRLWIWIPVGILLLIVVVVIAVLSAPVQTAIVQKILTSVNKSIRGSVAVSDVHVTPNGEIIVHGVSLKDPDQVTVASFKELRGRVDLWGIGGRKVRIFDLGLDDLRFDMAIDSSGTSNLERALSPRDTTKPPPDTTKPKQWIVQLDKLLINGGPTYIHNPADTLVHSEAWTLRADLTFKERKLNYNVQYDSPRQVHLKTGGSFVLAETIRDVQGKLDLRIDSTYSGGLFIPAEMVGRTMATVEYKQREDSLDVTASGVSSVLGSLHLTATAMFPPGVLTGHGDMTFENLKPASLWNDTTNLTANGEMVFVKDTAISKLNGWDVRLTFRDTQYGQYELHNGDLHIVTRDSTAAISGDFDTGRGKVELNAHVRGFVPKQADMSADVRLTNVNLHAFVPQVPDSLSPVSGTITVSAQNVGSDERFVRASAEFADFSFGHYQINRLAFQGGIHGQEISVDTLSVDGYGIALEASAHGSLNGDVEYAVKLDVPDVRDLQPLLKAVSDSLDSVSGAVKLDLTGVAQMQDGKLQGITAEGDVLLKDASYGKKYYVKTLDARLEQFGYPQLMFSGAVSVDSVIVSKQTIDSADVNATGNLEQFRMGLHVWSSQDSIDVAALFTARLKGDVKEIGLDSLRAHAYGIEWWSENPSTVTYESGKLSVDGLTIRSDVGVMRASGYMQRHGDQDMAIEFSGLRTGEIARLLKKPIPESTANIRVQFTGTDKDLVGEFYIDADSVMYDKKVLADEFSVQLLANHEQTTIDGMIKMHGDTAGVFGGEVPLQLSLDSGVVLLKNSPMTGHAKIIQQKLDAFTEFMPFGTKVTGTVAGEATFAGTPASPQWRGSFTVVDATYEDIRTGVDYRDIDVTGELVGDTLRIPTFKMKSVGQLSGSGTAVMAFPLPKDLALHLDLKRFQVMDSPQMRIRTSGHVDVGGALNALNVNGQLDFDEIIYRLTASASKNVQAVNIDSVLTVMRGDTVKAGSNPFSPTAIYHSMANELHLTIPGNCWVKGSGMNIELGGDLWMYKDHGVDPTINGSIQTRQGEVSLLGRRFDVTSGNITFEGPIGNPTLDVIAEYKPPSTTTASVPLQVHLYGTVRQTQFEFLGGMTNEEAITALLGGTTGGGGILSQDQIQRTASGAAAGQLTGLVGNWAGLDVLEYRPNEAPGSGLASGSLDVGSYVTDRLFVRVTQPIETGEIGQTVTVEYRLLDWLKLRAQQEAKQSSAFDLLIQLDWR